MRAARDERSYRIPDEPSLLGSLRQALIDFYYNSWRLVPANMVWGLVLLGVLGLLFTLPPLALPAAALLALPTAGVFRLATLIVREESVALSDALGAWRRFLLPALATGAALVVINFVLIFNIVLAILNPELLLWVAAVLSFWGLVASWTVALPYWALLTDPRREGEPQRAKLRLAALLVLIAPLRLGSLMIVSGLLLALSTIFFAALLTISVAFVALLATRYTLPAADRLERRETQVLPE